MIPISLKISGFLSYRDPVELDFTGFDVACISGHNGAGKSSLLDAITWALFGKARQQNEALIHTHPDVKAAEVVYTFSYEENTYRIQRSMPRGKSKQLEFQIRDGESWRPLTEATMRATQVRIEQTLRLDYETFVNAAFFLQGRADQFTQQNAGKRKQVLGNILGLEVWESYKARSAERRHAVEKQLEMVDGRLVEIDAELDEEEPRKKQLESLENELDRLAASRKTQESILESVRREATRLEEQRKLTETLQAALQRMQDSRAKLVARREARSTERERFSDLLARAAEVDAAYAAWKEAQKSLARWEATATQFREQDAKRQPFLQAISAEQARLTQERKTLETQEAEMQAAQIDLDALEQEIAQAKSTLEAAEQAVAERDALRQQEAEAREKYTALEAENRQFKIQMDALKERLERFRAIKAATCPLCGQALSAAHRAETLARMEKEGAAQGAQYRANSAEMHALYADVEAFQTRSAKYAEADSAWLQASQNLTALNERLSAMQARMADWAAEGQQRLQAVREMLEKDAFAEDARRSLAVVDVELKKLGYDSAAHDAVRKKEAELRSADDDFRALESARAALKPLEEEIANLDEQITALDEQIALQQAEYERARAALLAAESQTPDEGAAYDELLRLQERENQLHQEVGAARQKVNVLDDLRARKVDLLAERENLAVEIGRYKKLERAFGKDGVPALLIEQALPEIEEKANDLLDRLSGGQMSIRFVTQADYKDSKREDKKETLDIQISDSAGVRDYEMFSGGEAFRVNFAIRLALSEVLAQRKGARLQTLIIDEGFGSQDTQGRQRLIEAINQVKDDFAKILVITHLEALKDAFPTQIMVEKGERGSRVQVI